VAVVSSFICAIDCHESQRGNVTTLIAGVGAALTLQGSVMASVPRLYGVDVASHDPQLDHIACLEVVAVCSGNTD